MFLHSGKLVTPLKLGDPNLEFGTKRKHPGAGAPGSTLIIGALVLEMTQTHLNRKRLKMGIIGGDVS
jgi:hypothetical protein